MIRLSAATTFFVIFLVSATQSHDLWTVLKKFDLSDMEQIRNDWNVVKWLPGTVNSELQNYVDSPENIYIDQGALVLKAVNRRGRPCKVQQNKDIQGQDIHSVSNQPAGACCDICRGHPGCKTFAWNNFGGGTCWLKGGFGPVVDKGGTQLGYLCDLTSGRLESKRSFSPVWSPGKKLRIEFVAKVPTAMGAWPALWTLGREGIYGGWPQEGEIDVMEWVFQIKDNIVSALHWKGPSDWGHQFNQLNRGQLSNEFTTFGVELSAAPNDEYIQFYMKTQQGATHYSAKVRPDTWLSSWHPNPPCGAIVPGADRCTPLAPFDNEMTLIMNVAVGGAWGGCCGVTNYDAFNGDGATMMIKSATVYRT